MLEMTIPGSGQTRTYGNDAQGEFGSLVQPISEREPENLDDELRRLHSLAEDFEDLIPLREIEDLL